MKKINEKGLSKRTGEETLLEREGLEGNVGKIRIVEGRAIGVLERDGKGFYVRPYYTYFGKIPDKPISDDLIIDRTVPTRGKFRLRNMDAVSFLTQRPNKFGEAYSVRLG